MPAPNSLCPHCRQPLPALARLRGLNHCESSACRAKASLQALQERWQEVGEKALQRAAATLPTGVAPPLLLWLESAGRSLAPVTESKRYFLAARWRDAWQNDLSVAQEGEDTDAELPPAANALCGHCAGRCCVHGGSQAAFVGADTLRRWLDQHADATVDDAIADYLSYLPDEHVEGQCRFQAATGCTLPREMRSDICNRYRCSSLGQLGAALQRDPDAAVVVLTRDQRKLEAAVTFQRGVATPLAGVSGPDEPSP